MSRGCVAVRKAITWPLNSFRYIHANKTILSLSLWVRFCGPPINQQSAIGSKASSSNLEFPYVARSPSHSSKTGAPRRRTLSIRLPRWQNHPSKSPSMIYLLRFWCKYCQLFLPAHFRIQSFIVTRRQIFILVYWFHDYGTTWPWSIYTVTLSLLAMAAPFSHSSKRYALLLTLTWRKVIAQIWWGTWIWVGWYTREARVLQREYWADVRRGWKHLSHRRHHSRMYRTCRSIFLGTDQGQHKFPRAAIKMLQPSIS